MFNMKFIRSVKPRRYSGNIFKTTFIWSGKPRRCGDARLEFSRLSLLQYSTEILRKLHIKKEKKKEKLNCNM